MGRLGECVAFVLSPGIGVALRVRWGICLELLRGPAHGRGGLVTFGAPKVTNTERSELMNAYKK